MNIFVLSKEPQIAAQMHCDKHICKQSVEYAQLLSSAHHAWTHSEDPALVGLYKPTHKNHPATVWVRSHPLHYAWLYELACATWDEYTYRYGKVHASSRLRPVLARVPKMVGCGYETAPPQCMPSLYRIMGDSWDATVDSYRNYYYFAKASFATWKNRPAPEWWTQITV